MKTCEQCEHCMYVEHGDMYCDLTIDVENKDVKWVYDEFYMDCSRNFILHLYDFYGKRKHDT